jgi:hypothetical protein
MRHIPFTQYLRPNGRKRALMFAADDAVVDKADAIIAAGLTFETEELMNGMVSSTITHEEEGDQAFAVTANGPDVVDKITKMILDFDLEKWNARTPIE